MEEKSACMISSNGKNHKGRGTVRGNGQCIHSSWSFYKTKIEKTNQDKKIRRTCTVKICDKDHFSAI